MNYVCKGHDLYSPISRNKSEYIRTIEQLTVKAWVALINSHANLSELVSKNPFLQFSTKKFDAQI